MSHTYPDTRLKDDIQDSTFGGGLANVWDTNARTFIDSVLQFFEAWYLGNVRKPYHVLVAVSQVDAAAGEYAKLDTNATPTGVDYAVNSAKAGMDANDLGLGLYLDAVTAGSLVRIGWGVLPATITGLGPQGSPKVALKPDAGSTGKLIAQGGSGPIVGYATANGSALVLPPGVIL